jgi:hypothetical protein
MFLAVFRGHDPGGILWQPRLEFWYAVNKKRGTLPPHLKDADRFQVYDYCHASVRYCGRENLRHRYETVQATQHQLDEKRMQRTWRTPIGTISEVSHYDEWNLSSHRTEYRLKTPKDFEVLEYMLSDEEWSWDQEGYERDLSQFSPYGEIQFYFRRSPIQSLFISEMGFIEAIYAMRDHPDLIRHYVEVATQADDVMYDVLCRCPARVLNFGENIDAFMDAPQIWLQHLIPYYRRRTEQLHAAGKFVHIHIDGAMRPLLPYLQECPWDGIEAATPVPQGDVTLAEIKEAMGDQVLLDGIPALFFLPSFPIEDLIACVKETVDLFYPRLVLGISDEIPPDGDIERVRLVGEIVRDMQP